jgi:hypothetical protein
MKTMMFRSALLLTALLAACDSTTPSSSLPTDRFYGRFVAETRADGISRVRASFLEDEDLFYYRGVYLDGGDTLVFRAAQDHVELPGGPVDYVAELTSGILEDTRFEFDLQRPDHADAPDSWGTLPAPMTVYSPEAGQQYSTNDNVLVTWSNPGTLDDMWIAVEADCLDPNRPEDWPLDETFTEDVSGDPGVWAVNLGDKLSREEECARYAATLTLVRARDGTLDPAYAPTEEQCEQDDSCRYLGYVSVRQVRQVEVTLTR